MPDVELPDVEPMVVAFLRAQTGIAQIGTRVPNPRPKKYVRAYRTGGAALNRVQERAQVTVTCGAETDGDAWAYARRCRSALLNRSTRMTLVRSSSEISGPYDDPDPDTNLPRVTFTVELMVRGTRF